MDPELQAWQAYAVEGIPQIVLIGKDGRVHVVYQGYREDLPPEIAAKIEALVSEVATRFEDRSGPDARGSCEAIRRSWDPDQGAVS